MVRGQKKEEHKVLSVSEMTDLKQEKKELESAIDAMDKEGYGQGTRASNIDKGYINKQIHKIDDAIHRGSAPTLRGLDKDRMANEARELSEKIREGMPTQNEMDKPSKNPGAIRKNQMWEKNNARNIERWKQIQRTLEPGDPTASNVERLRRG